MLCATWTPRCSLKSSRIGPINAHLRGTLTRHQRPSALAPQHHAFLSPPLTPSPMCGIFCSITRDSFVGPDDATKELLRNRGPDSTGQKQLMIDAKTSENPQAPSRLHTTFLSTVLSLRGDSVVEQPLLDEESSSTLCWNGEAWIVDEEPVTGNDSQLIFTRLLSATTNAESIEASTMAVVALLASVRGPYAFVFYDGTHKLVYFGRDCLGRRSLLRKTVESDSIILSSVCDNASGDSWTEVEADGVYVLGLTSSAFDSLSSSVGHIRHRLSTEERDKSLSIVGKCPALASLLTQADVAFSSHEQKHPIWSFFPRGRGCTTEGLIAKVSEATYCAYTRSCAH